VGLYDPLQSPRTRNTTEVDFLPAMSPGRPSSAVGFPPSRRVGWERRPRASPSRECMRALGVSSLKRTDGPSTAQPAMRSLPHCAHPLDDKTRKWHIIKAPWHPAPIESRHGRASPRVSICHLSSMCTLHVASP
jgi:hypothetical protein